MQARLKKQLMALGITGVLATVSSPVWASGFQLMEQNAAGVGDWHAGGAAEADDASTGFYNAAGLTRIHNRQVVAGAVAIFTHAKFTGTVTPSGDSGVARGGVRRFIPNFHYAQPINDRTVFGFGITTPFGLATEYKEDFVAFATTNTEMKTINLNPNIAYKLNDKLSLGVGLNAQYLQAEFDNAIPDVFTDKNKGDDWGVGANFGALYEFNDNTRAGVSYRTSVMHHLKGKGTVIGGSNETSDITSNVKMPATTIASIYHRYNDKWAFMGTASYTQWDVIKSLVISHTPDPLNPGQYIDVEIPQNYRNTWNLALGAHYTVNDKWRLKTGVGFDQTPTNNADRNLRLPDANRIIGALGARYQATKNVAFDAGWTHLFMKKTYLDNHVNIGGVDVDTVGSVVGRADVLGLQMTWDIA